MKSFLIPFILCLGVFYISCTQCKLVDLQTTPLESTHPIKAQKDSIGPFDTVPEMIGGLEFFRKNLHYPEEARQNCLQAKVIFSMIIDEKGNVISVEPLTDDKGWKFNQAATDLLMKSKWRPAIKDGHPVKVRISIPIVFRLR